MIPAQNGQAVLLIAPVAKTNSATASATFDMKGADYATVIVTLASEKNTNALGPDILIQHCDTSNGTFTTLSSVNGADGNLVAAKNYVFHIDTKARARYGKVQVNTETTTNDDVTVSAVAILTRLEESPGSTSDMVGSTHDSVAIV